MQIALLVAVAVVIVVVGFLSFGGLGYVRNEILKRRAKTMLVCSLDDDCPDGFICRGGRCEPA